ncbi:MAG: hypothetical protein ACPIA7_04200 [Akkermansiaceae bacterium]
MKRNTTIVLAAILLLVIGSGGLFVAYKGYKRYQARQNQEFRYEGTMGKAAAGFQLEAFKRHLLSDDALEHVIKEQKLIDVWGLDDMDAAKIHIRGKFDVKLENAEVKVSYQDRDKQTAHDVLKAIVQRHYEKLQATKA